MTVGELIATLQKFRAERRVVVRGYEGGCDDIGKPYDVRLALDALAEDWYGPHRVVPDGGEPALLLPDLRSFRTERLP